jgi:YegS/Rv2252/BmrU family lipid kinase
MNEQWGESMKRLLLVVNPCAGKQLIRNYMVEVVSLLGQYGYSSTVHITTGRGDATEVVSKWGSNFEAVVVVGGDGSLNEVINGVLSIRGNQPKVGYIPAGSTNDFAKTLSLPTNIIDAAHRIGQGKPRPMDVGECNERYFTYIATFGAFTESSYNASQKVKNVLGHFAYVLESVKSLKNLRTYKTRIETEDKVIEGEFLFGGAINSTSMGGLFKFDPENVKLDDGLFEIVLVKKNNNLFKLLKAVTDMKKPEYESDVVVTCKASKLKITAEENIDWCLDGELGGTYKEAEIQNLKRAIQLIK